MNEDLYVTVSVTDKDGVLFDSFRVLPMSRRITGGQRAETTVQELADTVREVLETHCETQDN